MSNVSLFLGAGASFQFHKPTTAQFRENILKKDWAKTNPVAKSFLETNELHDIEHVLQAMKEVRESLSSGSTHPYLREYLKYGKPADPEIQPFAPTFQYLSRKINAVENLINKEIFSEYTWNDADNQILEDFYSKLFELLLQDTDRIFVSTTNYDQAIEKFCMLPGQDYSCIDGFHREDSKFVWKNENFTKDYNTGDEKLIFLYKVHGSINWVWDGSRFIKNPNNAITIDDAVLIFPTVSPKIPTERDPYKTLISEFKKRLLESDVCIVIGFSFRDTHINNFFREFIENNKTLIIISPHCRENFSEHFQKNEFVTSEAHVDWTKSDAPKNVKFIQNYVKKETYTKIFEIIKNNLPAYSEINPKEEEQRKNVIDSMLVVLENMLQKVKPYKDGKPIENPELEKKGKDVIGKALAAIFEHLAKDRDELKTIKIAHLGLFPKHIMKKLDVLDKQIDTQPIITQIMISTRKMTNAPEIYRVIIELIDDLEKLSLKGQN